MAWVRSGQVAAFVSDRPLLTYQAHLQPCDMVVVGDDFGPGAWVDRWLRGGPSLRGGDVRHGGGGGRLRAGCVG